MNHRLWDLVYCRNGNEKDNFSLVIKQIEKTGFTVRELSPDDFDMEEEDIPTAARFCSKELTEAGVQNLFMPKPEFRDRVLGSLGVN